MRRPSSMLLALGLLGCGDAGTLSGGAAPTPEAARAAETGSEPATPPDIETRLGLDARPFPLLTWSAHLIDVDYYDRGRFDFTRQLRSCLRGLEAHVPEVLGDMEGGEIVLTVGDRVRRIPVGTPTTTLEASEVVAQMLTFTQEILELAPDELHLLEYAAIDGFLAPLDPHTVMLPPAATEDLGVKTRGHFGGIGAEIRAFERRILISRVLPDSPAEKAGARDGDLIVKIDGRSTVNMATVDAQQLLRGPVGVDVKVRVIREERYLDLVITRGKIRLPTARHILLPGDVGYVGLLAFQEDTTTRMVEAIKLMRDEAGARDGLQGLILDLRGNVGGLLSQATAVVDQFVDAGDLVLVHASDGTEVEQATAGLAIPEGVPLVVLVDERSASASEIVSGSLKHLGRAAVVGRTTFGKGTVQMLREATPYGEPLALKMTIAEYRVAGDRKINSVGVRPQLTLLPVQLSALPGVVRYYDRERFSRGRQRYQTSFLPSAVNEEGSDAFALPEGPSLFYLDDDGDVEAHEDWSEEVKDYLADGELRVALEVAETLRGHAAGEAQRAALESLAPRLRDAGQGRIRDALGSQKVDWSPAPADATPPEIKLQARIDAPRGIVSGTDFTLRFEVHNTGSTDAHQVRMITECPLDELDGIELLVGKVPAGARVKRSIELSLMPWNASLYDQLTVQLHADREPLAGAAVALPLEVQGLPLPRFEFDWWVVDDPAEVKRSPRRPKPRFPVDVPFEVRGNGDGVLQPGERVLIAFSARNVGGGAARDARAVLNNSSGTQGLLEEGNVRLGRVKAGGRAQGAFGFSVSETAVPGTPVELELAVGDVHLRESTATEFQLPVQALPAPPADSAPSPDGRGDAPRAGSRVVVTSEKARLYAGPHADTRQLLEVDRGAVLRVQRSMGDWIGVEGPRKRRAWLPRDLVEATDQRRLSRLEAPAMVQPPRVVLEPAPARVSGETVVLRGTVTHEIGVADLTVSVEPTEPSKPFRKVAYLAATSDALDGRGPAVAVLPADIRTPGKLVRPELPFEVEVPLQEGSNRVIFSARDAHGVQGVLEAWVYRDAARVPASTETGEVGEAGEGSSPSAAR